MFGQDTEHLVTLNMPVSFDKLLDEPVLHQHTDADVTDTTHVLKVGDTITGDLIMSGVATQVIFPDNTDNTGGLLLGGDTNLYRSGTSVLKTDDGFYAVGHSAIGITAPLASTILRVEDTFTDHTSQANGLNFDVTLNFATTSSQSYRAGRFNLDNASAINMTGVMNAGIFAAAVGINPPVGIIYDDVRGNYVSAGIGPTSAGTVSSAASLFVQPYLQGNGVVTDLFGINVTGPLTDAGTATALRGYGIRILDQSLRATTSYGLQIANQTVTGSTHFAISTNTGLIVFNEGGEANSDVRMEGDTIPNLFFLDASTDFVSIGNNTPVSRLEVASTTLPVLTLRRVDTTVTANDMVGKIQFYAADTSSTTNFIVADIEAQATNTVATDINPGRLLFRTTSATVAATPTERMRIDEAGNVGIGTTTPQTTLDINGGMRTAAVSQSAAYQLLVTDSTVYVTTGVTVAMAITLPAASANTIGMYFFVYKVDAGVGTVAITPTGTDTLNGANAVKLIANQWNGALVRGMTATSWLVTSFTGL